MNGYDSRERRVVSLPPPRRFPRRVRRVSARAVVSPNRRVRLSLSRTVMNPASRLLHAQSTPLRLRSSRVLGQSRRRRPRVFVSRPSLGEGSPLVRPHPSNVSPLPSRVSARTSDNKRFFGNIFAISGGNTTCLCVARVVIVSHRRHHRHRRERIDAIARRAIIRASRRARPFARTGTRSRRRNIFRCTESAAWRSARARPRVTTTSNHPRACTRDRWDGERLKLKKIAATREGRRRATRGCYGDDNESGDHEERASVTVSRASRRASSS